MDSIQLTEEMFSMYLLCNYVHMENVKVQTKVWRGVKVGINRQGNFALNKSTCGREHKSRSN